MRDLEKASGVGRETIRFYIREGLLPEPDKTSPNSARYTDVHVARLKAIKRLQEERFLPLAVIRTLLEADDGDRWLLPEVFPTLDALLAQRLEDGGPARVGFDGLGLPPHSREHLDDLMIPLAEDGTVTARDAAILRTVQRLDDIGFTPELGFDGGQMRLRAMVATPDGTRMASAELSGPANLPESLGEQVSKLLADQDANAILAVCKAEADAADA